MDSQDKIFMFKPDKTDWTWQHLTLWVRVEGAQHLNDITTLES